MYKFNSTSRFIQFIHLCFLSFPIAQDLGMMYTIHLYSAVLSAHISKFKYWNFAKLLPFKMNRWNTKKPISMLLLQWWLHWVHFDSSAFCKMLLRMDFVTIVLGYLRQHSPCYNIYIYFSFVSLIIISMAGSLDVCLWWEQILWSNKIT